ncbi:asparagine synthase (glutamine-hydrolyzing) [Mesorhizobium japonicum]|uniref:asparagine synthase (glutamine-hydrolyzing) n=1 Tax=Mesorhizobium japonicum TaxID=2066070 RepID=UPI003B5B803F
MCGISGIVSLKSELFGKSLEAIVEAMGAKLAHRGPDDNGVWSDHSRVALSHRRLSILDLSAAGRQPMHSSNGQFIIVFNGEIYNHLELRKELNLGEGLNDSRAWKSHSDTETFLEAISAWGVEKALQRLVGMFAFALWDKAEDSLYLGRDRLGEKPLYYGLQGNSFLFASELKAFKAFPRFGGDIDRKALGLFLQYGYIPAPYSIYKNVFKLLSGSYIKIKLEDIAVGKLPLVRSYWSLREVAEFGQKNIFSGNIIEATDELDRLLRQAVSGEMLSDVPLGALLSGGIDSSTIVALMQAESRSNIKTFTIGFNEASYNEAGHAREIAKYLGTSHTEMYISPEQALSVIPNMATLYDEPFADVSQIPTFLISKLASEYVTVCLTGDGGDELFGGYNRYVTAVKFWRKSKLLPKGIRSAIAGKLEGAISPASEARINRLLQFFPRQFRHNAMGAKLNKLTEILTVDSEEEIYSRLLSKWKNVEKVLCSGNGLNELTGYDGIRSQIKEYEHRMMLQDSLSYLPDDILVKVDRATMGVSLEARAPMLDHRVVEFAWSLPLEMKIKGGDGKWILQKVLERYIPRSITSRPKAGFSVPIDAWLRGPLRPWANVLLERKSIMQGGFFDADEIEKKWRRHLIGECNVGHQLWNILMFQAWYLNEKTAN